MLSRRRSSSTSRFSPVTPFMRERLVVVAAELALGDAVDALDLLLLAQLLAVVRRACGGGLAVLARRIGAALVAALVGVATLALEEELHVFAPAEPANWTSITSHIRFFLDQTRRRLGGRQPLCGIGVTSRMSVILNPAACSARSADSRPEPGPFT